MKNHLHLLRLFVLAVLTFSFTTVLQAQVRPYNVSDAQVRSLLTRIETKTDNFRRSLTNTSSNSSDSLLDYVTEFENATDALTRKFGTRSSVDSDVEDVLRRASYINQFMQKNRVAFSVQNSWTSLRTDLDTLAQYYRVSWNWTNPVYDDDNDTVGAVPYTVSDVNVRTVIARLETNADNYRRQVMLDFDRSALNNTKSEDSLTTHITEFENSIDSLKRNFQSRRSTAKDVEDALNHAYVIDTFMRDYRLSRATENSWRVIRTDLNTLSTYYSVNWNWNRPNQQANRLDRINGTYRLNVTESDNVAEVVERATSSGNQTMRDRMKTNLERRLSSPDMLAIEKSGSQVTIASSTAPQITFNADGVARTETNDRGRMVKITATSGYDGVSINYEGERTNDFYVNFVPMNNGQLKVVRRIYLENRNETITVASVYDKISPTARWSDVDNTTQDSTTGSLNNTYYIPNNTALTAVLTTPISTKTSQNGDRFQMEITSPSRYDGAIIEGRVAKTERSGRVSGRAQMSLEFDTIRLRNGQTYKFAGLVDTVTLANGNTVTVNNEGAVRDNSQTSKTVTRAGVGAAIGALIGAIAGGGKGAVIGAGVGAGAGAGSVILQGRDDVELENGTQFSITATAPANVTAVR